jgi:hypothetical protein
MVSPSILVRPYEHLRCISHGTFQGSFQALNCFVSILDIFLRALRPHQSTVDQAAEALIKSAMKYLLEGGEHEAAVLLLNCRGLIAQSENWNNGEYVRLQGPRVAYDALRDEHSAAYRAVKKAFNAVGTWFTIEAEIVPAEPGWRDEMYELICGRGVSNQGEDIPQPIIYENLRFRSVSERRIAEALDRARIMYLPNCRARLNIQNSPGGRGNREADFVICDNGRFGILEVDGAPYHPPTRTVHDHERDRLFKAHGIRVIEHYDSGRCAESADKVVKEFLDILRKS